MEHIFYELGLNDVTVDVLQDCLEERDRIISFDNADSATIGKVLNLANALTHSSVSNLNVASLKKLSLYLTCLVSISTDPIGNIIALNY